jgi:hypothetical protein
MIRQRPLKICAATPIALAAFQVKAARQVSQSPLGDSAMQATEARARKEEVARHQLGLRTGGVHA